MLIVLCEDDSHMPVALILLALSAFQFAFMTEAAANSTAILSYTMKNHGNEELSIGFLKEILKQVKLSRELYEKLGQEV